MKSRRTFSAAVIISVIAAGAPAQTPTRARDLGVPFEGDPGPLNAITDVSGLEVGHTTILRDEGPVRTGVTAVLPRGRMSQVGVFANWFALNGNGEMTGTTWVSDRGILKGPVLITPSAASRRENRGSPRPRRSPPRGPRRRCRCS